MGDENGFRGINTLRNIFIQVTLRWTGNGFRGYFAILRKHVINTSFKQIVFGNRRKYFFEKLLLEIKDSIYQILWNLSVWQLNSVDIHTQMSLFKEFFDIAFCKTQIKSMP